MTAFLSEDINNPTVPFSWKINKFIFLARSLHSLMDPTGRLHILLQNDAECNCLQL